MKKLPLTFLLVIIAGCIHAQQNSALHTNINGLDVAYQKAGTGPALILLHGFTQDSRVWKNQVEGLSKNFTIVAWDAPGAGLSADPPDNYRMSNWADCLAILLDTLNIPKAHVLGISWGGVLAQEFLQRHPEKVLSLILSDTNPGWAALSDSVAKARVIECTKDTTLSFNEFVKKYLPGMFSDSVKAETKEELGKIIAGTHKKGFQLMVAAIAASDMRKLYSTIKIPVLLLWGEKDKRAPVSIAYQMNKAIPGSRLKIIKGAGHVSNMQQPERFNKIVKEFCLSLNEKK